MKEPRETPKEGRKGPRETPKEGRKGPRDGWKGPMEQKVQGKKWKV